jgi:type IV pilus assembly protein PilX
MHADTLTSSTAERGVALVTALVFLLLLTLIGISSMGTTSLEEKMSNNSRDRNLAFQAAETALFTAETWISSLASQPSPWPDIPSGLYDPVGSGTQHWNNSATWTTSSHISHPCTPTGCTSGTTLSGIATQPKYIIEKLGPVDSSAPNTIAYRITARGTGSTNAAVVMLQSTYVKAY